MRVKVFNLFVRSCSEDEGEMFGAITGFAAITSAVTASLETCRRRPGPDARAPHADTVPLHTENTKNLIPKKATRIPTVTLLRATCV